MVLAVAMQATVTQPCGLIASDGNKSETGGKDGLANADPSFFVQKAIDERSAVVKKTDLQLYYSELFLCLSPKESKHVRTY